MDEYLKNVRVSSINIHELMNYTFELYISGTRFLPDDSSNTRIFILSRV